MSMRKKRNTRDRKRDERKARKALYKQQAADGKEQKFQARLSGFNKNKHQHVMACGNTGCSKCFPQYSHEACYENALKRIHLLHRTK